MAPTAEKKEAREKEGGKQDKAKEKEKDKDKGEKEKGPKEKDKEAAAATAGAAAAGGAENRAASEEEKMTPVTAVLNEVGTVILLLASAEPVVQATALAALEGYADASHKNRVSLLNQHVLIPVLELTNSPDAAVRKNAVGCIAALSDAADVHPDLRKEDLIRQLVSLLNKNEAVDVIEDAAYALSNVAKDFANKVEIRKHGGMKALIHCLAHSDPDVKKNAALAVAAMLTDFGARTDLRLQGGIQPILDQLNSEYKEIQEQMLASLCRCAEDFAIRVEIRKTNGLKRVVDLLPSVPQDLLHLALLCIANCLEDAEMNNAVGDMNNFFPQVISLLGNDNPLTRCNAALVISRTARVDRNHMYLRDTGTVPALLQNILSADPSVVSSAALALGSLAKNELNQNELLKAGAVETLVHRLNQESAEVKRSCVLALSCCVRHAKVRAKVKGTDCVEQVIKLCASPDQMTVVNAVECIANLAEDAVARADIVRHSGVEALIGLLKSDDLQVQGAAALATSRCMQEPEARTRLKDSGGLPHLIQLVRSKDAEVTRNACWAISNAIAAEPAAVEACQCGALEILMEASRESNKAAKFAENALDKLLDFHMPAKYWLQSYLSADNWLADGFFDVGFAGTHPESMARVFPVLKELEARPVDKNREIILISASRDEGLAKLLETARQAVAEVHADCRKAAAAAGAPGEGGRQGPALSERTTAEAVVARIAGIVAGAMGGPVEAGKVNELAYKFRVQETKLRRGSNVVPVSELALGTFYHRALLFKVLLDRTCNVLPVPVPPPQPPPPPQPSSSPPPPPPPQPSAASPAAPAVPAAPPAVPPNPAPGAEPAAPGAEAGAPGRAGAGLPPAPGPEERRVGVPVTLHRSDYGRAWNTVALKAARETDGAWSAQASTFVVDLMFKPGRLMDPQSTEAVNYRRLT